MAWGSELVTGVVALVGTLAGGGVTLLGNRQVVHGEQRRRRDEHRKAIRVEGRAACVDYLVKLEVYLDWVRELQGRLSLPRDGEGRTEAVDEAYRNYMASWTAFAAATAAVRVVTTEELAADADLIRRLVGTYSDLVEYLRVHNRWPRGADCDAAQQAATDAKRAFVTRARALYGLQDEAQPSATSATGKPVIERTNAAPEAA